jgi:hypothetical protein
MGRGREGTAGARERCGWHRQGRLVWRRESTSTRVGRLGRMGRKAGGERGLGCFLFFFFF